MRKLMDEDNSELNQRLQPLMAWLFHVPSPNALNTAMAMTGAALRSFACPMPPLTPMPGRKDFSFSMLFRMKNESAIL